MVLNQKTRYSLIIRLKNLQDLEAWSEFIEIYQPLILQICIAKGLQYADAVDVTQEVLTRVAEAVKRFDVDHSDLSFRGWLHRVTRNLVIDFFRNRKRQRFLQYDSCEQLAVQMHCPNDEDSEFDLEFKSQLFRLAAAKVQSQVQVTTWRAFWQTEVDRRSVADVAHELGLNHGAVYMARSRVFAKLRCAIQEWLLASSFA